jgi:hypothetical protein
MILTVDALKIAIGEKNVTNTFGTAYYWLLSMVDTDGGNVE